MKLLEIKKNHGYYYDKQGNFAPVDKITKDDILRLVDLTLHEKEVDFDEFNGENLENQAHQIIYKSISEKLLLLRKGRQGFIDESERVYLEAYKRYKDEPSQQDAGDEISKMVDEL